MPQLSKVNYKYLGPIPIFTCNFFSFFSYSPPPSFTGVTSHHFQFKEYSDLIFFGWSIKYVLVGGLSK